MPFKSKLNMQHIDGTESYFLLLPIIYITWKKVKRIIPMDFVSDGHSIPKLLRSIAGSPFATKYPKSAWLHDYLIKKHIVPRNIADSEYSRAMKDEGATTFQRKRNYVGVRVGAFFDFLSGGR